MLPFHEGINKRDLQPPSGRTGVEPTADRPVRPGPGSVQWRPPLNHGHLTGSVLRDNGEASETSHSQTRKKRRKNLVSLSFSLATGVHHHQNQGEVLVSCGVSTVAAGPPPLTQRFGGRVSLLCVSSYFSLEEVVSQVSQSPLAIGTPDSVKTRQFSTKYLLLLVICRCLARQLGAFQARPRLARRVFQRLPQVPPRRFRANPPLLPPVSSDPWTLFFFFTSRHTKRKYFLPRKKRNSSCLRFGRGEGRGGCMSFTRKAAGLGGAARCPPPERGSGHKTFQKHRENHDCPCSTSENFRNSRIIDRIAVIIMVRLWKDPRGHLRSTIDQRNPSSSVRLVMIANKSPTGPPVANFSRPDWVCRRPRIPR